MARKKPALPQIKIRLPVELRRTLEREAAKNGRTLNAEIVYRLLEPIAVMEATRQVTDKLMDRVIEKTMRVVQDAGMSPPGGPLALRMTQMESARQPARRTIKPKRKGQ